MDTRPIFSSEIKIISKVRRLSFLGVRVHRGTWKMLHYKKQLAMTLALVLFVALAGMPLAARARRGSMVVVTMDDGSQVKGELLSVRADALLLHESESGQGRHLNLHQVLQVKVLKKTTYLDGAGIGICVGLAIGANNLKKIERDSLAPAFDMIGSFLPLPLIALGGGLLGAVLSMPKKISLAGKSPEVVQHNLRHLKRYARERDG
jgi:hypothetical protein